LKLNDEERRRLSFKAFQIFKKIAFPKILSEFFQITSSYYLNIKAKTFGQEEIFLPKAIL